VRRLELEDLQLRTVQPDPRPVLLLDTVEQLVLGNLDLPESPESSGPIILREVQQVIRRSKTSPAAP